ncbi:hypothetical protein CRM22_004624 [Opisthorchis felineus]|uniref:Uncharacterized protein n=1 Tax=Opisthorchis felineus TaxID=147828 RepID=A0A4S2LV73_OPIFE|nr:hypothetical protein CRM22_004624 [Opisthorchis felineus]
MQQQPVLVSLLFPQLMRPWPQPRSSNLTFFLVTLLTPGTSVTKTHSRLIFPSLMTDGKSEYCCENSVHRSMNGTQISLSPSCPATSALMNWSEHCPRYSATKHQKLQEIPPEGGTGVVTHDTGQCPVCVEGCDVTPLKLYVAPQVYFCCILCCRSEVSQSPFGGSPDQTH